MTRPFSDNPLISVVIPTYQRAALLERSLGSLAEQTLPVTDFEVVVVDDGSSDWTPDVCKSLGERLALRHFRIKNSGISAAKNLGLFTSRAPLVLFFDDDDLADPGLLDAHLDAHGEHPEENVAVLGYTTWAPELEVTPLMDYVTRVGQLLFAYEGIEDGEELDHTYFWGGRSSCKRAFLAQHGTFDPDFPAIIEDVELGFRLAKHGFKVVHDRSAKSYMVRPISFDAFAKRCVKRGRGMWLFNARHPDPEVERYTRVEESLEKWPSLEPDLEQSMLRVRELEQRHEKTEGLDEAAQTELHGLYRWTFEALQARGIAEAAAEESEAAGIASTDARRPSMVCPDPVFIIGSPRSGTSILAWSLAQHSEFWTEDESDIFFYLLKDGFLERTFATSVERPNGTWLGNHDVTVEQFLAHVGMGLNVLFTGTANGARWIDQTPANTMVVDRLAQMFPGAKFLHIIRDGRRVVHSMMNFDRAIGDAAAVAELKDAGRLPPWATDFRDACRTWARSVSVASEFCRRHPDRGFTVTNERLVTDPEGAMADIIEFLGERHESAPAELLRNHRINSSFTASGRADDTPPKLTEPWLKWSTERRSAFFWEAGEVMIANGLASQAELLGGGEPSGGGAGTNGAGAKRLEIRLDEVGGVGDTGHSAG